MFRTQQCGSQDRELFDDRDGATLGAIRPRWPLDFGWQDRRSKKSASIAQVADSSRDYPGVFATRYRKISLPVWRRIREVRSCERDPRERAAHFMREFKSEAGPGQS